MDENGSRAVHAACELAGLALSAWALDHMTDGALSDALAPVGRWMRRVALGVHEHVAMLVDAFNAGRDTVAIAERYQREDWPWS